MTTYASDAYAPLSLPGRLPGFRGGRHRQGGQASSAARLRIPRPFPSQPFPGSPCSLPATPRLPLPLPPPPCPSPRYLPPPHLPEPHPSCLTRPCPQLPSPPLNRVLITDHGAFVLVNVYVPNAGDRPDRPRLHYKLRFLAALRRKCEELAVAGARGVRRACCGCRIVARLEGWPPCCTPSATWGLLISRPNSFPPRPAPPCPAPAHPFLPCSCCLWETLTFQRRRGMCTRTCCREAPLDELYGQEERAALHALTAAYPGGARVLAWPQPAQAERVNRAAWQSLHGPAPGWRLPLRADCSHRAPLQPAGLAPVPPCRRVGGGCTPRRPATYSVWNEKTSARAFNRVRLPSALDPAAGPGRLLPGP